MLVKLVIMGIIAVLALIFPDRSSQLVDDLTIVNGVLCHLAPSIKTDSGVREGEDSSLPFCDPLVPPVDIPELQVSPEDFSKKLNEASSRSVP